MIIIDGSFRPVALDSGAMAILSDLNGTNGSSDSHLNLPREILNFLHARSDGELGGAYMRVNLGNRENSCRVFSLMPRTDAVILPMLTLYLKRELSIVDTVYRAGIDYHLTDREKETLIGVTMGLTSKELAMRMQISPNTVKAFLRLIMIKMGVATRSAIVAKLLDQNVPGIFEMSN